MIRHPLLVALVGLATLACASSAMAQSSCRGGSTPAPIAMPAYTVSAAPSTCALYRVEKRTVYEPREVTYHTTRYEPVCKPIEVTRYKETWTDEIEKRTVTVMKPITETHYREETYTIRKPVCRTEQREQVSYVTRYVRETSMREEPVVEWESVWENKERQVTRRYVEPVYTEEMRTETYTVQDPVTTCQTRCVDRGRMVTQVRYVAGPTSRQLTWQSAKTVWDPATGVFRDQRAGFYWTPVQQVGTYQPIQVWQSNMVQEQYPVTTLVPRQVTVEKPVRVCKYEQREVVETIPYRTQCWIKKTSVRQIPTTRLVPKTECVRKQISVQVRSWETIQEVRRIPVTVQRWEREERVEEIPHRVCRMVPYKETIYQTRYEPVTEEVTRTIQTPVVHTYRVPIDACGNPISLPAEPLPPAGETCVPGETVTTTSGQGQGSSDTGLDSPSLLDGPGRTYAEDEDDTVVDPNASLESTVQRSTKIEEGTEEGGVFDKAVEDAEDEEDANVLSEDEVIPLLLPPGPHESHLEPRPMPPRITPASRVRPMGYDGSAI